LLQTLDGLGGRVFADLDPRRMLSRARLRETRDGRLGCLIRIILQCYYRGDQVMRSLGMEPRPSFPKDFEAEQGDWSPLDSVRTPEALSHAGRQKLVAAGITRAG
jgi:hypothetical protein